MNLKNVKLMLAMENTVKRGELSRMLREIGFETIHEVSDRAEAAFYLRSGDADIVLCDAMMDRGEGMQLMIDEQQRSRLQGTRAAGFVYLGTRECERALRELFQNDASVLIQPYGMADICEAVFHEMSKRQSGTGPVTNPEPASQPSQTLEAQVTRILHTIGIPAHVKGYQYLRCAIILTIDEPELIDFVTKALYPKVAKQFATKASRVERAIRHAIEIAWDRGDLDTLNRYFGYTISCQRGKPTNSEFIAMIADRIRIGVMN